jgi:hypothetical protein
MPVLWAVSVPRCMRPPLPGEAPIAAHRSAETVVTGDALSSCTSTLLRC